MREIKFKFIYKGLPFSSKNDDFNYHVKIYTLDQLIEKPLSELCDVHNDCELLGKYQSTGLTDKNGVDIFEGDAVISKRPNGEVDNNGFIERVSSTEWYWGDFGTIHSALEHRDDVEVIGNIHQNPELLEQSK